MSCRETPGNSAITSYARLAATADVSDTEVQKVFHDLKRRHKETTGNHAADRGEVTGFLDHQAWMVRNDDTLTAARKHSLLERLSRARSEAADATRLPDMATFRAWQDLNVEVEVLTRSQQLRDRTNTTTVAAVSSERLRARLG